MRAPFLLIMMLVTAGCPPEKQAATCDEFCAKAVECGHNQASECPALCKAFESLYRAEAAEALYTCAEDKTCAELDTNVCDGALAVAQPSAAYRDMAAACTGAASACLGGSTDFCEHDDFKNFAALRDDILAQFAACFRARPCDNMWTCLANLESKLELD